MMDWSKSCVDVGLRPGLWHRDRARAGRACRLLQWGLSVSIAVSAAATSGSSSVPVAWFATCALAEADA